MRWLGLDHDEGPFYQMQRMDRYREVLAQMLAEGLAYPCYCSVAELDAMREAQMAGSEKPRYDGTLAARARQDAAAGARRRASRCCAFATRSSGVVTWDDMVKGRIEISNDELDDLVIARPDGTPTYNFCVVVDDLDMRDHPRDPRRRPRQQHAAPDQHLPRARRGAAGVRPPAHRC